METYTEYDLYDEDHTLVQTTCDEGRANRWESAGLVVVTKEVELSEPEESEEPVDGYDYDKYY